MWIIRKGEDEAGRDDRTDECPESRDQQHHFFGHIPRL